MIKIEKAVTLTIDGADVQILMNLIELARQKMCEPSEGKLSWTETEWRHMGLLRDRLQDGGMTT